MNSASNRIKVLLVSSNSARKIAEDLSLADIDVTVVRPEEVAAQASSSYDLILSDDVLSAEAIIEICQRLVEGRKALETMREAKTAFAISKALAQQTEQVRLNEERYNLAIKGSHDGIWDWDLVTNRCYYSERALEQLGYEKDELNMTFALARSLCHPDDLERLGRAVIDHFEKRLPYDIEYRVRTKSGEYKWIHSRGQAIWNKDGVPIRFAGSHRDVTDRIEAEKRVSEFYSTVSHELRTPLTSIRGSLGLIEGGLSGEVSEKTMRFVQIARTECDRLIRLINEILDLRKIEAGKLELRLNDVNPEAVLKKVRQGMQGVADEAKVTLTLDVQADELIRADEDRVIQVLTNLVSNAIKFSPGDSEVLVRTTKSGESCRFSVIDKGRGIPEDQMHKLFGKFQQVDSSDSRPKGGTGLGLAISKAIAEQHGGAIGVESKNKEGSVFWFEIPLVGSQIASESFKTTITGLMAFANPREDGGKQRVLIVEDDESARTLLTHQLESMNLEVSNAANGKVALQLVRIERPDLIILDIGIPPPDGFEVIRILKDTEFANLPLIIYTSRDLTKDEKRKLVLGPTTHLVKSQAAITDLAQAVQKTLDANTNEVRHIN